jgi:hypothetical protein
VGSSADRADDLRPRVPMSRLVEALGTTLVRVLSGPADHGDVLDVAILDLEDSHDVAAGDLVLGVGVRGWDAIAGLAERLAGVRAAGVVVKAPEDEPPPASLPPGLTVLGLTADASWSYVAFLVRTLLVASAGRVDPGEDLFALADVVSDLVDAPVTIEDKASQVLAFSGRQDETDEGRRETILGRQVPPHYRQQLEDRGVFRQLAATTDPVYVESLAPGVMPRIAVSVRAGSETVGSMWAAVHAPLSPEREAAFGDAAKVVALHLLRLRAGADGGRRLRADLVATVLEGGQRAREAASRLGLPPGGVCVLAAQPLEGEPSVSEAAAQRLAQTLDAHCAAVRSHAAVALLDGVAYAIVAGVDAADATAAPVIALAERFVGQSGAQAEVVIGVGRPVSRLSAIGRSRMQADRVLRVLRHERLRPGGRRVAGYDQVQVASLLLRVADLADEDGDALAGPLDTLTAYDAEHRSNLVDTVAAYLDAFGDVARAAAQIHVHPNTFRYRLRRAKEISGIDLDDPDARLAATLQVRLHRLTQP